jgi:hypothetical protein
MSRGNAVIAVQMALGLVPKILDPVDLVMAPRKLPAMIDPVLGNSETSGLS